MTAMHPLAAQTRREFLTTTASGLGMMALGSMLTQEGLLVPASAAADGQGGVVLDPLAPRLPHFPARAKNCICIFMEGLPARWISSIPNPSSMNCMASRCRRA